jgi:hypothetical protein
MIWFITVVPVMDNILRCRDCIRLSIAVWRPKKTARTKMTKADMAQGSNSNISVNIVC